MSVKTVTLAHQDEGEFLPLTWRFAGEGQVLVTCEHGNNALITGRGDGKNWQVDAAGKVSPSLWYKGTCECHYWMTLAGFAAKGGKPQ